VCLDYCRTAKLLDVVKQILRLPAKMSDRQLAALAQLVSTRIDEASRSSVVKAFLARAEPTLISARLFLATHPDDLNAPLATTRAPSATPAPAPFVPASRAPKPEKDKAQERVCLSFHGPSGPSGCKAEHECTRSHSKSLLDSEVEAKRLWCCGVCKRYNESSRSKCFKFDCSGSQEGSI